MPPTRARLTQAERRQRNQQLRWDPEYQDRSWMKYARCGLCKKTFAANNNARRRVDIDRLKYRGIIVCDFCRRNPEWKTLAKCLSIVLQMTEKDPPKWIQRFKEARNGSYAGGPD